MGPALYIIAILGCADGGDRCEQVRVAPVGYGNADACALAVPSVLAGSTDVDAPEIEAECRASGAPQMTRAGKTKPAG